MAASARVVGAINNPVSMIESGPAGGVLGAVALGNEIGEKNLIVLDIGGTTAKTALVHAGKANITTEYRIEWDRENPGYPIRTPVIDLVEIGNGGGSIAWVDEGGRLHVGPQSAGRRHPVRLLMVTAVKTLPPPTLTYSWVVLIHRCFQEVNRNRIWQRCIRPLPG